MTLSLSSNFISGGFPSKTYTGLIPFLAAQFRLLLRLFKSVSFDVSSAFSEELHEANRAREHADDM